MHSSLSFLAGSLLLLTSCGGNPVEPRDLDTIKIQGTSWTYMGLEEVWVTALASTPQGLYAGTDEDGVFRWDTETRRWKALGLGHASISSILYVPDDPARLLVAVNGPDGPGTEDTGAAVYSTENGGRTWYPSDGGLDASVAEQSHDAWASSLAIDPCNPNRLFMGQSYSVLRSVDGGESWKYVLGDEDKFGMGAHAIAISPACDGEIWVGGQTGFFTGVVHRSADWGNTWQHWSPDGGDQAVYALRVDPWDPERLWAGMMGEVRQSDDGGARWTSVLHTRNPSFGTELQLLNDVLYAAAFEEIWPTPERPVFPLGLYRSHDRGLSWDTLQAPAEAQGALSTTVDGKGRLLIGTRSGVWRVEP